MDHTVLADRLGVIRLTDHGIGSVPESSACCWYFSPGLDRYAPVVVSDASPVTGTVTSLPETGVHCLSMTSAGACRRERAHEKEYLLSDPDPIQHVLEPTGTGVRTAAGGARRYQKPLKCFRWPDIQYLLTDSFEGWSKHKAPRLGASLAFYTLLSLAPLLLVVVAVVGLVFGHTAAQREIVDQVQMLVGTAGAKTADALLQASQHRTQGALATLLGLLTLLFSASGVMMELRDALNTIWEVPTPPVAGVKSKVAVYLRDRLLSFAMVLSVGFLLVVSLAISSWVAALGALSASVLPSTEALLHLTNSIVSFIVITGLFAAIYKIMPDVRLKWRDVILGGAVTSLLFTIGKLILALYLGKASFASSYGAFASLVVLVIWVYYSGQIFFFGAEFTRSFANGYGSQPEERSERLVILAEEATKPTAVEPPRIILPS